MDFNYVGLNDTHYCQVCGEVYHACNDCIHGTPLQYKEVCDTLEHFEIQQVVAKYCGGLITKEEAAIGIKKCNVSDMDTWKTEIQVIVKELLAVNTTVLSNKENKTK